MQKYFVSILILLLLVVFFAVENSQPVYISFGFRELNADLSIVIFLCVTFGAASSYLLSIPHRIKQGKIIKEKEEKIELLENELLHLNIEKKDIEKNKEKDEHEDIQDQ
jgi:uncharacterized integral membrane protein